MPRFGIGAITVVMSTPELAGISQRQLGPRIGSLAADRVEIVAALELLFTGIWSFLGSETFQLKRKQGGGGSPCVRYRCRSILSTDRDDLAREIGRTSDRCRSSTPFAWRGRRGNRLSRVTMDLEMQTGRYRSRPRLDGLASRSEHLGLGLTGRDTARKVDNVCPHVSGKGRVS